MGGRQTALIATLCVATLALMGGSAHAQAPAEVYAAGAQRGAIIVLHGGGWIATGPGALAGTAAQAERFRSLGWTAHNLDYSRGLAGLHDVLALYDRLRWELGASAPICVFGVSAGGHLALMLAALRPKLDCAIAEGAPTDLTALGGTRLAGALRSVATRFFGERGLARLSPALRRPLRMPVLLAAAANDPVVPFSQARRMQRAASRARLVRLDPGGVRWLHSRVSKASLGKLAGAERWLLRQVAG